MYLEKCPECGAKLTQEMLDANLCWECGCILDKSQENDEAGVSQEPQPGTIICPVCGTVNGQDHNECFGCGAKFEHQPVGYQEYNKIENEAGRQAAGGPMNARDVAADNWPEGKADPVLKEEEDRPAKNMGAKIRGLAIIILICGILSGGVWLLVSMINEESVIASISLLVSSIVAYYPLYGFGILVENSEEARKKNNEMIQLLTEIKNRLNRKEAEEGWFSGRGRVCYPAFSIGCYTMEQNEYN